MKRVLITGSNGFIGSYLTDFYLNKGFQVYALDRPSASFNNLVHYTDGKTSFTEDEKTEIFGELIQYPSKNKDLII